MSEPNLQTLDVLLRSSNDKETQGKVQVISWDPPARTRRALKTWGICGGAAVVCVIMPIVHFVAVPGFFLAGPIAAFFIYAQESKILGGECACPSCGKPFQMAKQRPRWPLSDVCSSCHEGIDITPRQALRLSETS